MSGSYRIEDPKGRFISIAANASMDMVREESREFLICCDIRDHPTRTFGGGEYSYEAIAKARAARAGYSVHIHFSGGQYNVRWQ
jgi:hypothetical protein